MFRGLFLLSLWALIQGLVVLADVTSTVASSSISSPSLPPATTQIPTLSSGLPSSSANATIITSISSAQSSVAQSSSNVSTTIVSSTTKSPFITLTGTTSKTAPTASTTGSGALKNGVGMCLGLMTTTFVAVVLL